MGLRWHARRHGISTRLLLGMALLVEVALVLHSLLRSHAGIGLRNGLRCGHAWAGAGHLGVGIVLGRLDIVSAVDAVLRTARGFRRIETCLGSGSVVETATAMDATYLDKVLAFCLCDERLELGGGEGVDETRFGDDEK